LKLETGIEREKAVQAIYPKNGSCCCETPPML